MNNLNTLTNHQKNLADLGIDLTIVMLEKYNQCTSSNKINMTIGVYYDENGTCLLLDSVKLAETHAIKLQPNKIYIGTAGCDDFCNSINRIFFKDIFKLNGMYVKTINTAGGSAALRISFELLKKIYPNSSCWIGTPAWSHYSNILNSLRIHTNYFEHHDCSKNDFFSKHLNRNLAKLKPEDIIVIQGPCHNPTGIDYTIEQFEILLEFLATRKAFVIFDCAYIGLASSVENDLEFLNVACRYLKQFIICTSFSKTFTIYNERAGCLSVINNQKRLAEIIINYAKAIASTLYFMPPHHGALVISTLLQSDELTLKWTHELSLIRNRIQEIRKKLDNKFNIICNKKYFFSKKKGLFSLLPMSSKQLNLLYSKYNIFITSPGRLNISSLNNDNLNYFCESVSNVLNRD